VPLMLEVTTRLGPRSLHLGVPGGVWTAALLLALMALALVLGLRELRGGGRIEKGLALLRALGLLGALMLALSPRLYASRLESRDGRRVVLFDVSRSMGIEGVHGRRSARARALAERWQDEARELGASVMVFDATARPAELGALARDYPSRGAESRIRGSIEGLLDEDLDGSLGCVVVVSDGADSSLASAEEFDSHGVRVHSVVVGADDQLVDDALAEVRADPVGFLRQPGSVRVRVRSSSGGAIPVALRSGEELVDEELIEVPAGGEASVELHFTPGRLGRAVYRVSIPIRPQDTLPENNERPFLVRVERDRLRVLLVAGRPSWDERFLRAFLKGDPGIDLVSFFILRTADDQSLASPEDMALIPFPTDELFREHLNSFDVVFLMDFDYAPYGMRAYLPRLRDYVRAGGALAMLGGDQSFASAGYGETPLAEVLPTRLPRGDASESSLIALGDFRPRPSSELIRQPLVALGDDVSSTERLWAGLAPLQGANILGPPRGDAQVLLRHPTRRGADGEPLPILVLGHAGDGRVLELASDSSFRWGFVSGGATGDPSVHERFWDRALRWLSKDPSLEPARMSTDHERYAAGAPVGVTGEVADARYRPLGRRGIRLELATLEGEVVARQELTTDDQGGFRSTLTAPEDSRAYVLRARLASSDDVLAEQAFVVESAGSELARPQADAGFLEQLSRRSQGQSYARPEDAPSLSEFDASRSRVLGVVVIAPFDSVWAFLIVVALLGADWILRRRYGRR